MTRPEESYLRFARFFHAWVLIMEYHTRRMEVRDSSAARSKILIVSAPTDAGLLPLTRHHADGECLLLCFSDALQRIARDYGRRHRIRHLTTLIAPFFHIPVPDESLDTVYANCLFDLCDPPDIGTVLDEIRRALRWDGRLFSVHMGVPSHVAAHVWAWLVRGVMPRGGAFHPVTIGPSLPGHGLEVVQSSAPERFGFPLRYVEARKTRPG